MAKRRLAIIELAAIFLLIMLYIWWLRYRHHDFWIVILGLLLASHALHDEAAVTLGFHLRNLRACLESFLPMMVLLSLAMLAGGIVLQTMRPVRLEDALLAWTVYLPWGLAQQYILNGYFVNRLTGLVSQRSASLLGAVLFSGVHLPNWFLMIVAFAAGYCSARVYTRYQNLYFLGFAHATIGVLVYLVVPDSITHHLVVGPAWFRH